MMKVYEVRVSKLSWDRGAYDGDETLGYYASKAKAERVAAEAEANRKPWGRGGWYSDVDIIEFEVDTEA